MNKLEQVVRPFVAGDVFTSKSLPAVQPVTTTKPDITVTWGRPITLQMKAIGITNLYGGAALTEVTRRTSTKRIFNPDDDTMWVDVERIDYLKMRDTNQQEHEFTFNNPA